MRIETVGKTTRVGFDFLFVLCMLFVLGTFSGCGEVSDETMSTPTKANETNGTSQNIAHFRTFELAVPEDWSLRGNVGKVYEGDGMFLLVGPLEETGGRTAVEEKLAEELELFYNTEYYRSQVRWEYEKEWTDGAMNRLVGTLYNDRNATILHFAGTYCEQPGMYCFYFWQSPGEDAKGEQYMEMTYESIRFLE